TGAAAERAIAVAGAKVAPPFLEMILRGFLCNTVVVLACWFQAGSKELIGKIFAIWFPIMLFVYAGFEHSIANMTYIPLGMFLGADVSLGQMFGANLIPVTIGNMLGGAVFVPFMYHFAYRD
ncbi:MAG: formate/nitrite transporter family protein, partial [Lachnospiraceae bacterium]|nr:formate/nitrite transporter family protein [Lachnospiraceae bacterium]